MTPIPVSWQGRWLFYLVGKPVPYAGPVTGLRTWHHERGGYPRPHERYRSMISSGHLIGFTVTSLIIIVIPGPGVLFVVGRALAHGRQTALATAAGHATGNYLVAACVA